MLSSHGREIGTQDALKKESRGLSRAAAGKPRFPRLLPGPSRGERIKKHIVCEEPCGEGARLPSQTRDFSA